VPGDGLVAQKQFRRDVSVAEAGSDESKDIGLPFGELTWQRMPSAKHRRSARVQGRTKLIEHPLRCMYESPERLKQFLGAMTGVSMGAAMAIAERFPWDRYQRFVDLGAAQGCLPVQVALHHPHLSGGGFDLPAIGPVFEEYVASFGLGERLRFYPGDFWNDPFPDAEVYVLGHILHDWNLEEKYTLLRKSHDALPEGGALIVYEAIIDDERRENAFGLLVSLNMIVESSNQL
jgi:hypothetical protein